MRGIGMIALLAVMVGLMPAILSAASAPSVGSVALDFILPSQDGAPISLNGYRGKWVVLYSYPKGLYQRLHDRGA
jgi:peroxiredoxin Q/BCP